MSTAPAAPVTRSWPADLLAFAVKNKVDAYLDPLWDVLTKLFPTATRFQALLEQDPELHDDWSIVFELEVPKRDVPDYLVAKRRWYDESSRVCPAPLVYTFQLSLVRVP